METVRQVCNHHSQTVATGPLLASVEPTEEVYKG